MTNQVKQEAFYIDQPFITQEQKTKYWEDSRAHIKASESEINSLKQRVEELIKFIGHIEPVVIASWRLQGRTVKSELEDRRVTIEELTTSNNKLREALEKTLSRPKLQNEIDEILSSTPTQSLAEHDNATIERIATALENAEGELKYLPEYVALVRGMKLTP